MAKHGYSVRVAGGAVRDVLAGKMPKDLDLATDCPFEDILPILDAAGVHRVLLGVEGVARLFIYFVIF